MREKVKVHLFCCMNTKIQFGNKSSKQHNETHTHTHNKNESKNENSLKPTSKTIQMIPCIIFFILLTLL